MFDMLLLLFITHSKQMIAHEIIKQERKKISKIHNSQVVCKMQGDKNTKYLISHPSYNIPNQTKFGTDRKRYHFHH